MPGSAGFTRAGSGWPIATLRTTFGCVLSREHRCAIAAAGTHSHNPHVGACQHAARTKHPHEALARALTRARTRARTRALTRACTRAHRSTQLPSALRIPPSRAREGNSEKGWGMGRQAELANQSARVGAGKQVRSKLEASQKQVRSKLEAS